MRLNIRKGSLSLMQTIKKLNQPVYMCSLIMTFIPLETIEYSKIAPDRGEYSEIKSYFSIET